MLFQLFSGLILECLKYMNMTNFEYEIEKMKKNSIYIIDCPAYFLSLSHQKQKLHACTKTLFI